MRFALTLAALLLLVGRIDADEPAKKIPTDDAIIKLCGDKLSKMFADCGVPEAITVNGDKNAFLDYGPYGFTVKKQTVIGSYFFEDWKGTFKGVKYGDTKEQAVTVLGRGYTDVKGKDFEAFGWPLKEQKATFWLYFTDNKVDRVQITLDD